ncbi:MAG: type II/IV secretion system protein [Armatimonadetes bacterium]|nr:type II/IV secretion system protein [Armatimonadota bacterium]
MAAKHRPFAPRQQKPAAKLETKAEEMEHLAERTALEALQDTLEVSCEWVQENLVALLKEELVDDALGKLVFHLRLCRPCQTELDSLKTALGITSPLPALDEPDTGIVDSILQDAIKLNASDIHLEPMRQGLRVRLRVDGVLHEHLKIPEYAHQSLINRIKIMADMNLAERRLPQTGRIRVRMADKDYDLRASTFPFQHGEKAALRILDRSAVLVDLGKMGLSADQLQEVHDLLHRPSGLLLVAGPTGCGKTTVALGLLKALDPVKLNIVTIEDPVEYVLEGISHSHVNRKAGLTYPEGFRHLLQQDPDVVFLGEIQDRETAEAALQGALTGHLIISVMHASDAVGAIARLRRLGVDPGLLSSTLIGVVSSRLARKVCAQCRQAASPSAEALRSLGLAPGIPGQFAKGAGCETCRSTGYRGREGVLEVLEVNDEISGAIKQGADEVSLFNTAVRSGFQSLLRSAASLVTQGVTSAEEALRVTSDLREMRGEDSDG